MYVGRARVAGWQRPGDRWRVRIDFARSGRVRNIAAEGLLRSLPALLPVLITFRRLEPNGHTGPQVTVMGCLAASDHCCGQDIPATCTLHQHSPAQALFAGFRIITPHNHFTVSQPANAKEATALIRLLHACVTVAGSLAQL